MSFDFEQMVRSKEALRQRLAALPIAEKLRLLDVMRERALAIRDAKPSEAAIVREQADSYPSRTYDDALKRRSTNRPSRRVS